MKSVMKISIRDLIGADVGASLPFTAAAARPKLEDLPKLTDLNAEGTVEQLGDRWLARGTVTASIRLQCVRCLQEFAYPVRAEFAEEFSRTPTEDQFPAVATALDLVEMLRTVILLTIPPRPLHDPKCRGLCDVCGKNLNEQPHQHPGRSQPRENPFSKLKEKPR